MPKSYDPVLVVVSALIALWAAYDALRIGGRVNVADRHTRPIWIIVRALVLGIGIWSMHFVAMLALRMWVPVRYDPVLVLVSMLVAVGGSAGALAILAQESLPGRWVLAALSTGVGISGMHFTAMAGMRLPADTQWDPALVALSIGISIGGPLAAMQFIPHSGARISGAWSKRGAALLIAVGIVGMHYTAMAAIQFVAHPASAGWSAGGLVASPGLALVVTVGTAAMIGMAEFAVVISRREEQYFDQLRALTARIEAAREAERLRIAREIHDELGQALTVLKLDLGWLRASAAHPDEVTRKISGMGKALDDTLEALGRLAAGLRPPLLDELGLPAAIRELARDFSERTGLRAQVELPAGNVELDERLAVIIYRTLQEALTNVARHADASDVHIAVRVTSDHVELEVRDTGRGITDQELADPRSLGLLGMRERARTRGGHVTISGTPGHGTIVRVTIPLVTPDSNAV